MIASYLRKRESAAFEDFGLDRQAEFFEREADRLGEAPPVVDAGDVLADPEGVSDGLVRPARHRLRSRHAALAARPPAHRRALGPALVPDGRGEHRLRPARSAAGGPARRRAPPRRPLPALLRAAFGAPGIVAAIARGWDQFAFSDQPSAERRCRHRVGIAGRFPLAPWRSGDVQGAPGRNATGSTVEASPKH